MSHENFVPRKLPVLAERSREHRNSQLFYWKLKQGLGDGTNVTHLQNLTMAYWQDYMKPYLLRQEQILLPLISSRSLAEQFKKDHCDINDLIISLSKSPTPYSFSILAAFIANHIRFEEGWLFSYLEKALPEEQLKAIGDQLDTY
ncbi:MAG: hypothetical protein JNK79_02095 [Chitinophagaceae bacterium]|nr:hypothetical protein [Chitinophagaceae bacterium]